MGETNKDGFNWPTLIAWLALVVALIGLIPGACQLKEYFSKSSAGIIFDSSNSRFYPISSNDEELDSKTSLVLLKIRFVGKGEKETHIAGISTSVFYKGKWIIGTQIHPRTHLEKVSNAFKKMIYARYRRNDDTNVTLHMGPWKEFEPGKYALSYGESKAFSYACQYDIPGENRFAIEKLRVQLFDYLGNKFQTEVETDSMMAEKFKEIVLLLD